MDAAGGRFAPSPTGPLHLGSLLAAVASYLDARRQGIPWRLRFDDLDEPRNQPGAEDAILGALDCHGLHWDGPVTRQSERIEHYTAALSRLEQLGLLFYCRCSRKHVRGSRVYPGTCRGFTRPRPDSAVRLRVDDATVSFHDIVQGDQRCRLAEAGGDFVVRRRDGIIAYQLATAVDDGGDDIARVIRGRDLLATTPRQIHLMERLELSIPAYGHVPLLLNRAGRKLSKQNHARPLDNAAAADNLIRVLAALGIDAGADAHRRPCDELLAEAAPQFAAERLPRTDLRLAPPSDGAATHRE